MKLAEHLPAYRRQAAEWLAARNMTPEQIMTGREAWGVAHGAGICRHAYDQGRDVFDAHIQTALQAIMPNAVFKDPKRY